MPGIEKWSRAAVRIQMLYGDQEISSGTAFFWRHEDAAYLVTNWHNLSGRDRFTDRHLCSTAAEPDRLRISYHGAEIGQTIDQVVMLRDQTGASLWLEHPSRKQVDIVALRVDIPADSRIEFANVGLTDHWLEAGTDVFVLGYPGVNFGQYPVWKRASIATEPMLFDRELPYILIDTASRPGMSGSPVVTHGWDPIPDPSMGGFSISRQLRRGFLGIYSGRFGNKEFEAQLGIVWPSRLVHEVVSQTTR